MTEEAKTLTIEQRIRLVEEIWNSIAEDNAYFELTEAQRQELDRRVEASNASPSRGRTWQDIKTEFFNSN
jgi:putative addiction module component (TIGR02574 family)